MLTYWTSGSNAARFTRFTIEFTPDEIDALELEQTLVLPKPGS